VLITFDKTGVSSHSNHISLYHGARDFIAQLARSTATAKGIDLADSNLDPATLPPPPIDLYTLTSVNFLRKYSGIFDVFATVVGVGKLAPKCAPAVEANRKPLEKVEDNSDEDEEEDEDDTDAKTLAPKPDGLVFAVPLTGERGAAFARVPMLQAHISQMVWFRYGWIYLSRYMFLNSLRRETVPANLTSS
jgi:N-acetylglucosaminylphosphatidylinositol deacetylase